MANYTMHHLQNGGNTWEVVDQAGRSSLAANYSATSTYAVGEFCMKDGQLYKCNTAISTAEAWTAAHWTAVTVGGELSTVKDGLDSVTIKTESVNLIDTTKCALGVISATGTSISSSDTRYTTDWIPVESGDVLYLTGINLSGEYEAPTKKRIIRYYFYTDKDLSTAISGVTGSYVGYTESAPVNAKYVRVSWGTGTYGLTDSSYPCLTSNWYPQNASETVPYTEPETKLINQPEVDANTSTLSKIIRRNDIVKTISHQGYRDTAPKCTKWAYVACKEQGFSIAENDINASSNDNRVLFMWHDSNFAVCGDIVDADNGYGLYTDGEDYYWYDSETQTVYDLDYQTSAVSIGALSRVNGSDLQCTITPWDVIKNIDVGLYFDQKYQGTKVMTFEEWVLLCKQLGLEIYIDRKINTEYFVSDLVGIVKKHGMLDHATWVINVTATIGQAIRSIDPNARLAVITRPSSEELPAIAALASTGRGLVYDLGASATTAETISEAISNGIIPEAYYVEYGNASESDILTEIRRLVDLGCTSLTLDKYFVSDAYEYLYE